MAKRVKRTVSTEIGPGTLAVGYVRVSTDDQALGPDAQRAALAKWAKASGATLVSIHEDIGVSGAAPISARPGLLSALAALAASAASVLVVAKRDRLARDPIVSAMAEATAERAGGRIVSAAGEGNGDDPTAILMRRIVDAFAEYERLLISARTIAALAVKSARGERTGGVPLGSTVAADGVHLQADAAEALALDTIRELRTAGRSIRSIAAELNDRKIPARGALGWHPTSVARVLARTEARA